MEHNKSTFVRMLHTTGTAAEMVWPGGDLGFVQQMVRESAALPRGTVHWYTSLVGRKDSLKKVRTQLYGMGVTALRTTEFFQGRTSRWAVAWSWDVPASLASVPLPGRPLEREQSADG